MSKALTFLLVAVIAAAVALGAFYLFAHQPTVKELEEARREASLCVQERATLKSRVSDLESMLSDLRRESAELADEIRQREEELARNQTTQDELVAELQQEITDGKIRVERLKNQLRVDLVDEILFDSGEASLKTAGKAVLQRVASVLADSGRQIRVQGHTDDVPIAGRLARTFPTNWELSAARAVNVVRFLQEEARLGPDQLSATAFSQYRPRAANDSSVGRQKNRRIEILLDPVAGDTEKEGAATEAAAPR